MRWLNLCPLRSSSLALDGLGKLFLCEGSSAPTIKSIGRNGGKRFSEQDLNSDLQLITNSAILQHVRNSWSVGFFSYGFPVHRLLFELF